MDFNQVINDIIKKHQKTFEALHNIDEFVNRLIEDISLGMKLETMYKNQENQIEVEFVYQIKYSPAKEDYEQLPPTQKNYVEFSIKEQFKKIEEFAIIKILNYSKLNHHQYTNWSDEQTMSLELIDFSFETNIMRVLVKT